MQSMAAACTQGGKDNLASIVFCGGGGQVLMRRWSESLDTAAFLEFGV